MGEGGDHNIIGFICQRDFLQGLRLVQSKAPLFIKLRNTCTHIVAEDLILARIFNFS